MHIILFYFIFVYPSKTRVWPKYIDWISDYINYLEIRDQ